MAGHDSSPHKRDKQQHTSVEHSGQPDTAAASFEFLSQPTLSHPTPGTVMQLQRSIGNRATRQLVQNTSLGHTGKNAIQRQADFGLAAGGNVSDYAGKVRAYADNKANKDKSFEDLINHAVNVVNDDLQAMNIPPVKVIINTAGTIANFRPALWVMVVNKDKFSTSSGALTIGQLSSKQVLDLASAIYHEARHAEQMFRMAQWYAGQHPSYSHFRISSDLGALPLEVVKAAKAQPLAEVSNDTVKGIATAALGAGLLAGNMWNPGQAFVDAANIVNVFDQAAKQARQWYQDRELENLVYDRGKKIEDKLDAIVAETGKLKRGGWDATKVRTAIQGLKQDTLPTLMREKNRVSAQKDRKQMVAYLSEVEKSINEIITLSQTLINTQGMDQNEKDMTADLIKTLKTNVMLHLDVADRELLIERDADAQGAKVKAAY